MALLMGEACRAKLRICRALRGVPHCAMLLLIGVSPMRSFCHLTVGHRRRSAFRMAGTLSELVSMHSRPALFGVGEGGGDGFDLRIEWIAPLTRGSK